MNTDGEHAVQFMYFNSFNRAMKSTLPHVVTRVSTQQQCDDNVAIKDASHVISDLELDFTRIKKRRYTRACVVKDFFVFVCLGRP